MIFSWEHHRVPPVKYRLLEVLGSGGIFSAGRFSTSRATACAAISTVISLHCVSLDSIRLPPRPRAGGQTGEKVEHREDPSKHRCVFLPSPSSLSLVLLPLLRKSSLSSPCAVRPPVRVRGCKSVSQIKSEH